MKIIKFLKASIICIKFRFHWEELKLTKFPILWWNKKIRRFIVFCPYCGEYICQDGLCSNPFCPERINDED